MISGLVSNPFQPNAQLLNDTCTFPINNLEQLDNDDLIEACFRNYYLSMSGAYSLEDIYLLFKTVAYQRLAQRGVSNDDAEYLLRSGRFVHFVKNLLTNPVNESLTNPSASAPGDDEEETSAIIGISLVDDMFNWNI